MKKRLISLTSLVILVAILHISCSKEDNPPPAAKTKTELITTGTWKFEKAEAAILGDISGSLEACNKDNTIAFTSTSNNKGTGIADEGGTKCNAANPQTVAFNWTLENNETKLVSDKPLFPGGSGEFTIVSLTESNLVVSQPMTIPPVPTTTVTITLKH